MPGPSVRVHLLVPFDRPEVLPMLYRRAKVVSAEEGLEGTTVVALVSDAELAKVREFVRRGPARGRLDAPEDRDHPAEDPSGGHGDGLHGGVLRDQ